MLEGRKGGKTLSRPFVSSASRSLAPGPKMVSRCFQGQKVILDNVFINLHLKVFSYEFWQSTALLLDSSFIVSMQFHSWWSFQILILCYWNLWFERLSSKFSKQQFWESLSLRYDNKSIEWMMLLRMRSSNRRIGLRPKRLLQPACDCSKCLWISSGALMSLVACLTFDVWC